MTSKKRIFIHPYKGGSTGAKALADGLGAKRILTNGKSRYSPKDTDLIINWGSSSRYISNNDFPMFNDPTKVAVAANKLKFFQALESFGAKVPWTEDPSVVKGWLEEGNKVCVRTILTGHSGSGIIILDPEEKTLDIPSSKLYTKYVPKAREYRVHVVAGEVIRVQRKILKPDLTTRLKDPNDSFSKLDVNWEVRNHDGGFIYVTNGVEDGLPPSVKAVATTCVRHLGLDFGAVDIIFNAAKNTSFALEVNTSPGLEGGTIDAYVEAFSSLKDKPFKKPVVGNRYDSLFEYNTVNDIVGGTRISAINDILVGDMQTNVDHAFQWEQTARNIRALWGKKDPLSSNDVFSTLNDGFGTEVEKEAMQLLAEAAKHAMNKEAK